MTRIIIDSLSQPLMRLDPSLEQEFEAQILRCADRLFPSYEARAWKPVIRDWLGRGAQPDLILLSAELDTWYVVEVELVRHSVTSHIRPQLETLRQGIYDRGLVPSMLAAFPELSQDYLEKIAYKSPELLCIADDYSDALRSACRDNDFEFCVLVPYHGDVGVWALHATQLATPMQPVTRANEYHLRRGNKVGNKEFLELPRHFPLLVGQVTLVGLGNSVYEGRIHRADVTAYLVVEHDLLPKHAALWVSVVDRDQRKLRMEVA